MLCKFYLLLAKIKERVSSAFTDLAVHSLISGKHNLIDGLRGDSLVILC